MHCTSRMSCEYENNLFKNLITTCGRATNIKFEKILDIADPTIQANVALSCDG